MMLERLSQPTADPLALLSNVSNTQHGLPSSSTSSFIQLPPPHANSSGSAAGYGEAQNRVGNVNQGQARPGQARTVKCYNRNGTGHIARNCTQPKRPQNFEYFKDKMLLMQAQENRVALDAEQLLFLASGPDNAFDDDYVKDNEVPVVHSNASSILNDTFMMIYNDMEQVELYERRAKFELTKREQKINEQLRLVISDRHFKEETLKRELHSPKLQLASTINRNKSMVIETTFLKQDIKQKENKYLADFLNMKSLKEKVKDKLAKQDQSLQTVHMLCRARPLYNEQNKVAIGYKNPLCLTRAKQAQPALYNGHEILKDNHAPAKVHNTEDTLEIAEITRKKMNAKMTDPSSENPYFYTNPNVFGI
nr:integrase, catalytic region, zinc finger, CCHC-type, peptidase aspartic, catalytic [Tanacetum cinerariifolium]